jgi:threonine synthase
MEFTSTRSSKSVSIEEALLSGTAVDGGLYLPNEIPSIDPNEFNNTDDYISFSVAMLHPYFIDSSLGRCLSGKVK